MPTFSRNFEETIQRSLAKAKEHRHESVTVEHLLWALTEDADAVKVLEACLVGPEALREDVAAFIDNDLKGLVFDDKTKDAKPTAAFQRVIQRATIAVQSGGRDEVTGDHVLVALFSERESPAVLFLQQRDMSRYDAVNFIAHGIVKGVVKASRQAEPAAVSAKASKLDQVLGDLRDVLSRHPDAMPEAQALIKRYGA